MGITGEGRDWDLAEGWDRRQLRFGKSSLSHNPGLIQMKDPPLPLVGRNLNLSIIPEKKRKQIGIKTHTRMAGGVRGGGYSDAHAYEYGYVPSHQSISPGSAALKRGQSTCIFNNFLTW